MWIVERDKQEPVTRLLTRIPGAGVIVLAVWSPKGVTIALHIVHLEQQKSAIIAVPKLEGDGVVLYESELLDAGLPLAWAPSGRVIAFFRTVTPSHECTRSGPPRLTLLVVQQQTTETITGPNEMAGSLRVLDDGTSAWTAAKAHRLTFATAPRFVRPASW